MWSFTPGLDDQLQQCISAAKPDENNKWQRIFKHKINVVENSNLNNTTQISKSEENISKFPEEIVTSSYERLTETVGAEPILNMSAIIYETRECTDLLKHLAAKLTSCAVNKLCGHVFTSNDLCDNFLSDFYTIFLPTYIKLSIDVNIDFLIQAKFHSSHMSKLIRIFLQDREMPSKPLQDFINTLNDIEKTCFIVDLPQNEISDDNFVKNIFIIYLAYRDCTKLDGVQNCIISYLSKVGHLCVIDKTYGKLLLTFLQIEKSLGRHTYIPDVMKLIEVHKSPFKRPCANILNDLISSSDKKG